MSRVRTALAALALCALAACRGAAAEKTIVPVAHVDLDRHMGRGYVIAAIPTRIERHDCNPVETYRPEPQDPRPADTALCR
jgi:lipocalin